jgi:hypothetical protein
VLQLEALPMLEHRWKSGGRSNDSKNVVFFTFTNLHLLASISNVVYGFLRGWLLCWARICKLLRSPGIYSRNWFLGSGILEQSMGARNRVGTELSYLLSSSLCSLAARYVNPIPTRRFLAPINCYKIPALKELQWIRKNFYLISRRWICYMGNKTNNPLT